MDINRIRPFNTHRYPTLSVQLPVYNTVAHRTRAICINTYFFFFLLVLYAMLCTQFAGANIILILYEIL